MSTTSYAVIGSNCFTGSHIVDALLELPESRVLGISRALEYQDLFLPYKRHQGDRFEFHQIDAVKQYEELIGLLDERKPDVVINVAALSEVALSNHRPVEYFEINTLAVAKLCNHLRTTSYLQRYVHISSAEIFGSCDGAVDESRLFNPSTPYAVSKAAADMFLNSLIQNFEFPTTLIRSTNVYGKHQQLFKIIPRTAIYVKMGKTIELHGGGTSMKSFIHIRDVVSGLLLAIQKEKSGTFHFSVPSEDTVADVVRTVCDAIGADFDTATRVVGERLGQDSRYWLDCGRANRELGWKPEVPFVEGVQETVDWINQHWDQVQQEPLEYIHRT
jgi:dTDP-glucose 4,6-dehydratase